MVFGWLRRRRRRRLQTTPFPEAWDAILRDNVTVWSRLPDADRARLGRLVQVFVVEKTWEGCGGLEITEEIRVTVSAQACLLLLGLEHEYYRKVKSILVYPSTYYVPDRELSGEGSGSDDASPILGLAAYAGPVVLAWDAVRHGGIDPQDGHNLVYHEFAHKLDMLDGWVDGTPPLKSRAQHEAWQRVTKREFERLRRDSEKGRATLLDAYGATNEGEFFAVTTECFFERSTALRDRHPDLYEAYRGYYNQDPASW